MIHWICNFYERKLSVSAPLTHVAVDPISGVLLLCLGDDAVGAEVVGLLAAVAGARPEHRHPPVPRVHLSSGSW